LPAPLVCILRHSGCRPAIRVPWCCSGVSRPPGLLKRHGAASLPLRCSFAATCGYRGRTVAPNRTPADPFIATASLRFTRQPYLQCGGGTQIPREHPEGLCSIPASTDIVWHWTKRKHREPEDRTVLSGGERSHCKSRRGQGPRQQVPRLCSKPTAEDGTVSSPAEKDTVQEFFPSLLPPSPRRSIH